MLEDKILKNYNVLCINCNNDEFLKDIKDEILKQEIITKSEDKLGLILLAGNMLSLGITINSCDIVMLMNNTLSSDKIMHLINIDIDMMHSKKINSDGIIQKLMDIWKGDPINSFKNLLKNLDNDYIIFDNPTQKLLNAFFTKSLKDNKVNSIVEFKNENDELQKLPSGKEIIKDNSPQDDKEKEEEKDDEKGEVKEIQISFTKDVLPYIIPLVCILTIKNKNMDFVKTLNDIKNNPELMEVFDDQCLI